MPPEDGEVGMTSETKVKSGDLHPFKQIKFKMNHPTLFLYLGR